MHTLSSDFTVLPAYPCVYPQWHEPFLPLPSRPKLVFIYWPRRDGRLSRPHTHTFLNIQGEMSFLGDELVEGGVFHGMHNGKNYTEVRNFQRPFYMLRFYFVSRCYSSYMETIIADLCHRPRPHVIIMNSCLWDITRLPFFIPYLTDLAFYLPVVECNVLRWRAVTILVSGR